MKSLPGEPLLRTATLRTRLGNADEGNNDAYLARLDVQGDSSVTAYVKEIPEHEIAKEILCAVVGRAVGIPIPRPFLVRIPSLDTSSLAFGCEASSYPNLRAKLAAETTVTKERLKNWPHLIPSACFDEFIANADRHPGNILYDGVDEFLLIDHGLALRKTVAADSLSNPNQLFARYVFDGVTAEKSAMIGPRVTVAMTKLAEVALESGFTALTSMAPHLRRVALDAVDYLKLRQPHLPALGHQRVPNSQGSLC